ncbi:MAG: GH36-type glycosyl hydrolase domain-containing protein [Spirochaeta sp.]
MVTWSLTADGFTLAQPHRLRPWYNFLSNDSYGIKISHLADGYAETTREPRMKITRNDPVAHLKGRYVYVRDQDGTVWNPSFRPALTPLDTYACTHEPGVTTIRGQLRGVSVTSLHAVPLQGNFELWHIQVENHGTESRSVQIFPQTEMLMNPSAEVHPVYFSWFTNSEYLAKERTMRFFRTDANPVAGYCSSLTEPDGFDTSIQEWRGDGDIQDPAHVREGRCSGSISAGDAYIACFQYDLELEPNKPQSLALLIGPGEGTEARSRFSKPEDVLAAVDEVRGYWKQLLRHSALQGLPEGLFKEYAQGFLGYQIVQQSTGIVREGFRGYRDVAQDAMGLVYYDPARARDLLVDLCRNQHPNGRAVRQWSVDGSQHDERDFRDLPFWLPIAVAHYIDITGDAAVLTEDVAFLGDSESAPVWEHISRGVRYALQYGPDELLYIGAGDWNDALSGLGIQGQSLWLNQFAYYALGAMEQLEAVVLRGAAGAADGGAAAAAAAAGPVDGGAAASASASEPATAEPAPAAAAPAPAAAAEPLPVSFGFDIPAERDRLYRGVQRQWTGRWFARGIHEDGTVIGGPERIFLLPQAWFTISGMAERDPERGSAALDAMTAELDHDHGLLICNPGFEKYDAHVGNLSCLAPGMAENYAVYNHASAYGIYALLQAGRNEDALRYLRRLLPFFQDAERTLAEPYVLVNFYNGGAIPDKRGRGGIPWLTGTVHWLALVVFRFLIPQKLSP